MADNVNVTEGSGKTVAGDDISSVIYQRVKLIHGADGTNDGDVASANPFPVTVNRVTSLVDGTVSVGTINRVNNVVDGTLSTVSRVSNVVDGTLSTITGVDRVRNLIDGTISTVTFVNTVQRVQNVVDGTLTTVTGVDRVRNVVDGTLSLLTRADRVMNLIDGTLSTVTRVDRVHNLVDGTLSLVTALTGITNSISVHLLSTNGTIGIKAMDGTFAVRFSPANPGVNVALINGNAAITPNSGIPAVNIYATTGIFTVSGSVSGSYPSGFTLVAPSANYNFKVFAYSLQTTGIVSEVFRFTNGGASVTEFWRGLVTAVETTSTPKGANLAISPPAYLFATGTSTTLALKMDTGSLVHYSVSYIKESA